MSSTFSPVTPGAAAAAKMVRDAALDRASANSFLSAITFLVWDLLLSFSDEVDLIWQKPNGWFRWLYIYIRYVPLISEAAMFTCFTVFKTEAVDFASDVCNTETVVTAVLFECLLVAVEIVLAVRVYVLYDRSRRILLVLLCGLLVSGCLSLVGIYLVSDGFTFSGQCLIYSYPRKMLLVCLPPAAYESALFILTTVKFRKCQQEKLGRRPILQRITHDGIWAFALAQVVMVFNVVIYNSDLSANALTSTFPFWATSTLSFIGTRVLLSLRSIASKSCLPWESLGEGTEIRSDQLVVLFSPEPSANSRSDGTVAYC
ncbi:hypothetical protein BD413DRAFT_174963 [Trametes elegans]|nr:hypothetical protein BD413DRAFT_174963 [Trametes elegans]